MMKETHLTPSESTDLRLSDEGGFEQFYKDYSPFLFRICFALCGDSQLATEMVQNIFCSIWERRHTIQINGTCESYLYNCAKYQYYNHCRSRNTDERAIFYLTDTQPAYDDSTQNQIEYGDLFNHVSNLVEKLPDQCRKVYKLSREEGLKTPEIANQLLLSEKTVKNHLTKALSFLRQNLKDIFVLCVCFS